jgi:hypothetical protein
LEEVRARDPFPRPRGRLARAAVVSAAVTLTWTTSPDARAQEAAEEPQHLCPDPAPTKPTPQSDFPTEWHPLALVAVGSCVRPDPTLGTSGFCGELAVGVDLRFADYWHATAELGAGLTTSTTAGDPNLGISRSSGGGYLGLRLLLGFDVTQHFYMRGGVQGQFVYSPAQASGAAGLVEIGTHLFTKDVDWSNHLDIGLRQSLGSDGVSTSGTGSSLTFAYGTTAFARVLFL